MHLAGTTLLAALFLVSATAGADEISDVFGNVSPNVHARLETLKAMESPAKVVEAVSLFREYSENEFAADARLKGHFIVLTGIVTNLSKAPRSGGPVIHLNGLPRELYAPKEVLAELFEVQLGEDKSGKPALVPAVSTASQVKKGWEAALQCKVNGKRGDFKVDVEQCLVLNLAPPQSAQR
jgi:hypothetical protein